MLLDADTGQPTERWEHPAQTSLICIPGGRFAITNSADQIMVYESEEPSIIAGLPGELLGVAAATPRSSPGKPAMMLGSSLS